MILGAGDPTHASPFERLQRQAACLADEVGGLPLGDLIELRACVRERLDRDSDLDGGSQRLRPLVNRILDVLDVSWLTRRQGQDLEAVIFLRNGRSGAPAAPARLRPPDAGARPGPEREPERLHAALLARARRLAGA